MHVHFPESASVAEIEIFKMAFSSHFELVFCALICIVRNEKVKIK